MSSTWTVRREAVLDAANAVEYQLRALGVDRLVRGEENRGAGCGDMIWYVIDGKRFATSRRERQRVAAAIEARNNAAHERHVERPVAETDVAVETFEWLSLHLIRLGAPDVDPQEPTVSVAQREPRGVTAIAPLPSVAKRSVSSQARHGFGDLEAPPAQLRNLAPALAAASPGTPPSDHFASPQARRAAEVAREFFSIWSFKSEQDPNGFGTRAALDILSSGVTTGDANSPSDATRSPVAYLLSRLDERASALRDDIDGDEKGLFNQRCDHGHPLTILFINLPLFVLLYILAIALGGLVGGIAGSIVGFVLGIFFSNALTVPAWVGWRIGMYVGALLLGAVLAGGEYRAWAHRDVLGRPKQHEGLLVESVYHIRRYVRLSRSIARSKRLMRRASRVRARLVSVH